VVRSISNPPSGTAVKPGTGFAVTDTVVNDSPVDSGKSTTTRYHLSPNGTKDSTDRLLMGSRVVPNLAPSSGHVPARR
jgi:hypothetical protein